jgi:F420-dependent oxidoreductase-like protein
VTGVPLLGIQLPQFTADMDDIAPLWREADRLGFRSAWLADHLEPLVYPSTEPILEAWTTLAVLASQTSRIRVGVLVTANTFREPAILARMAANVDRLSGGRLEVGLGAGWHAGEHAANGLAFPPLRERFDRLDEACRVLRLLWTEPTSTFAGRYYRLDGAPCEPKPLQRPLPLLIGGRGEKRTLRIVAEHAHRWNGVGSLAALTRAMAVLDAHCEAVGRHPADIERTAQREIFLTHDDAETRDRLEVIAARWGATGDAVRELTLVGRPSEVVDRIGELGNAGIQEVIVQLSPPWGTESLDQLERIAGDVAHALAPAPACASPRTSKAIAVGFGPLSPSL